MWNYLLSLLGYSDSEAEKIEQNDHQDVSQNTIDSSWEVMNILYSEEGEQNKKEELNKISQPDIESVPDAQIPSKNKKKKNKNKYKTEQWEDYAKHINTKDYMKYHENKFMQYTFDDNYFNLGSGKNNKKKHYLQQPKKKMS